MKRILPVAILAAAGAISLACGPARAAVSLGAYIPGVMDYAREIRSFNAAVGKQHAMVLFFRGMDNTAADDMYLPLQCIEAGVVPVIGWETGSYSYEDIIAGRHDRYLHLMAASVRDLDERVLISLDSEMNNCGRRCGNPSLYIEMWRHVHDIFSREEAYNVEWIWAPNWMSNPTSPSNSYNNYYPGGAYVDWVGTEGFNWMDGHLPSDLFDEILNDFAYRYPEKPAIILYMGADQERAEDKAAWISEVYDFLRLYGNLKAIIWWNDIAYDLGFATDFRVLKVAYPPGAAAVPRAVTDAYRRAIAPPAFISTLPHYAALQDWDPEGAAPLIDLEVNKTTFSATDEIIVTADIQPISDPFYPYVRLITPAGEIRHYVRGLGFRGRRLTYVYGGPYVLEEALIDYPVLSALFAGVQRGTYLLEAYPLDESGRRIGPVDRITLAVE